MKKTLGIIGAQNRRVKYPESQQPKFLVGILWKKLFSVNRELSVLRVAAITDKPRRE
jgi:hypothetical protein